MNEDPHLPPTPMHQDVEECNRNWGRRAEDHLGTFKQLLTAHTKDEMERYNKILGDVESINKTVTELTNKIDDNDCASSNRHDETQTRLNHLSQSIENFMAEQSLFHEAIKRAFPRDDDGKPDYDGHRSAHLSWISDSKETKEFKKFLRNTILGAAAVAVVSFVTLASWAAFLKGPV